VFTSQTSIFNLLPAAVNNATPLTFEDLNQAYGYVLYRAIVNGGAKQLLKIKDLRDYGIVFINGKRVGILDRRLYQDSLWLDLPRGKARLDILVENLGRINYGPYLLKNKKGITEKVLLNGKEVKGWQMFELPFDHVNNIKLKTASKLQSSVPVLKKGYFTIDKPADTYLDFSNWGKGVVWVNGHNLGRYWEIGPQQTVYVPVEWLKPGKNEITVFELIKPQQNLLKGVKKPVLDVLKK
jgi:beta-galactosidase